MRSLLVLVLLIVPVAGQSYEADQDDADAVYAPVQLLLDQYPTLMRLAIDESTLDGTPHDANELMERMQAFFAGFEAQPPWPDNSTAKASAARESYARIGAMLSTAALIPGHVGTLSQVDAGCAAYPLSTTAQAQAWWDRAFADVDELDTLRGSLRALSEEVPAPLTAAPVLQSLTILDAWLEETTARVQFCLEEIFVRNGLGIPVDTLTDRIGGVGLTPELRLTITPSPAHVGQTVFVSGRVIGPRPTTATITAPSQDWSREPIVRGNGFFEATFIVPIHPSLLGDHLITAQAGNLDAEATLTVTKAPVNLLINAPKTVVFGERFTVQVIAQSPLTLPRDAQVGINGAMFPASLARLRTTAPDNPATLYYSITYAGNALHEAASRDIEIQVTAPIPPPKKEPKPWEIFGAGTVLLPTPADGVRGAPITRPEIATGTMIAIASTILFFIIVDLAIAARRVPAPIDEETGLEIPVESTPRWPAAFVQAFAALAAFLVRRDFLPPGATARDVGKHLAKRRLGSPAMVHEFEAIRYGRQRMQPQASQKRSSILARWWRRMGGQ